MTEKRPEGKVPSFEELSGSLATKYSLTKWEADVAAANVTHLIIASVELSRNDSDSFQDANESIDCWLGDVEAISQGKGGGSSRLLHAVTDQAEIFLRHYGSPEDQVPLRRKRGRRIGH